MSKRLQWNSDALPYDFTLDQVLYDIRRTDDGENLLLDAVTAKDILDDSEGVFAFDALVTPYAKLQRKMEVLQGVMERSAQEVKPLSMQVTDPFKQRGVANVAVVYELSDGQTVTVYFHNPDVDPDKMAGTDEVISWKWLLNKKDITIVVAPERGNDLNVREVARRIMKLAEKNSAAFVKANIKKNETMARINGIKEEVGALEKEFKGLQHDFEVKQQEVADGAEPTHYSNLILNNLVETFGWKRAGAGSVEKDVGGGAVGGELNPTGIRVVVAAFDEPARRYLTLQSGFDTVLDLDCRNLQPKEAAEKFDSMVRDWAVSTAVKVAQVPDEAVQSDMSYKKVAKEIRDEAYAHGMEAFTDGSTRVAPGGMSIKQMKAWYAGWDAANLAAPIPPVAIVINEEQQPKSFDTYLDEAGGDTYEAARAFFKSELQGKIIKTVIGDVHMTGSGFKEMKRGMKSDPIKARTVAHVGSVLSSGNYDGKQGLNKERKDSFIAFHFFEKEVDVGELLVTAGVTVGERSDGYKLLAYGLGHSLEDRWAKKEAGLLTHGEEPREPTSSGDVATTLDATLANSSAEVNEGLNIVILKVIDKATGKRLTELEDDVGQEGHKQDVAKETPAQLVDAAYKFDSATDEFKEWLAESVSKAEYSPFVSARDMDKAAKANGAMVEWGMFGGKTLDSALEDEDAVVDFNAEDEWDALPVTEDGEPVLDGDFKGHPFRGNQYKQSSHESKAAIHASGRAKHFELKGDTKELEKAHKVAHFSHVAALVTASTKKSKHYHKTMAKFHAKQAGIKSALDSAKELENEDYGYEESELGSMVEAETLALDSATLDGIDADGYVGKIKKDGETVGRIDIGDDGKAMVFVGATGDKRVTYNGKDAYYSDDDAGDFVDWLFTAQIGAPVSSVSVPEPDNYPAIELTGKELGDFPDTEEGLKDLRKAAVAFLETLKGKQFECAAIKIASKGEDYQVEIRERGILEVKHYSANPLKLKAMAAIEKIIKTASSAKWEDNYKQDTKEFVLGYYHLKTRIKISDTTIDARVLVEKDSKGLLHYDLIIEKETAATVDSAAVRLNGFPDHKSGAASVNSTILPSSENVNIALDSAMSNSLAKELLRGLSNKTLKELSQNVNGESVWSDDGKTNVYTLGYAIVVEKHYGKSRSQSIKKTKNMDFDVIQSLDEKTLGKIIDDLIKNCNQSFKELTTDSIALDSASGMVLNLFIEGEEPEVVEEDGDELLVVVGVDAPAQKAKELFKTAVSRKDGNKAFADLLSVSDDIANKINDITGLDVHGYIHSVDESAIRHILKEHGDAASEAARGQVAITEDDFASIPIIVSSPDFIEKGEPTNEGLQTIIFKKKIGDMFVYIQEVRDGRNKLTAKTLWKIRIAPPAATKVGEAHTSETFERNTSIGREQSIVQVSKSQATATTTKPTSLPTPEVIMPVENSTPVEDPQKQADQALFKSVIDGTVKTSDGEGILSPQLADDLEAAFYRNQGDAETEALFEQAVNAYQAAMMAATADIK